MTTPSPAPGTVLAMVHLDGHVAAAAPSAELEAAVRSLHDLARRAGIQGWRLRRIGVEEAALAYTAGMDCAMCAMLVPCGCPLARVLDLQCPHGSKEPIHRLAHQTGYCANDNPMHQGPPL